MPAMQDRDTVAEWSVPQIHNLAVLGSSPALASCWICFLPVSDSGCLLPVGVFKSCDVVFELFVSKYLNGVPVN